MFDAEDEDEGGVADEPLLSTTAAFFCLGVISVLVAFHSE